MSMRSSSYRLGASSEMEWAAILGTDDEEASEEARALWRIEAEADAVADEVAKKFERAFQKSADTDPSG